MFSPTLDIVIVGSPVRSNSNEPYYPTPIQLRNRVFLVKGRGMWKYMVCP